MEVFAITITINGKGPHIVLGRNANSIYPWHSGGAPIKRDSKENQEKRVLCLNVTGDMGKKKFGECVFLLILCISG